MKEKNIIEELMEEKQLTLHQIAKLIDYDVAVVSRVKNRIQKMSHRMAFKISQTFGYDLNEVMQVENVE